MINKFFNERFWGTLAHVPIVTIIWTAYVVYKLYSNGGIWSFISHFKIDHIPSLPITPLILTLLSIPIALTIMHMKKRSRFVHDNAQEAYLFNVWLLKSYSILFVVATCGVFLGSKILFWIATVCGVGISLLCFCQAIHGIAIASAGNVFRYWYPGR